MIYLIIVGDSNRIGHIMRPGPIDDPERAVAAFLYQPLPAFCGFLADEGLVLVRSYLRPRRLCRKCQKLRSVTK